MKIANICVKGLSPLRYLILNWTIGICFNKLTNCCKRRFAMVYNVSINACEDMCASIKKNKFGSSSAFGDSSAATTIVNQPKHLNRIIELCDRNNIKLSHEQVSYNNNTYMLHAMILLSHHNHIINITCCFTDCNDEITKYPRFS